ncbi:MAG: hypothetical protein LBV67_00540 [Streptococcaceae bacterium]|jgi:hypothetical protein|nr:hypothetical protein [Streptococcaceae bacterium]
MKKYDTWVKVGRLFGIFLLITTFLVFFVEHDDAAPLAPDPFSLAQDYEGFMPMS